MYNKSFFLQNIANKQFLSDLPLKPCHQAYVILFLFTLF